MARKSGTAPKQPTGNTLQHHTLILDNGAHTIKAGFAPSQGQDQDQDPNPEKDCHIIANTIARSQRDRRTYIGSELLDECWDFGELAFRRPVERGYVVNWEGEKAIWERSLFGKGKLGGGKRGSALSCEPAETNLVLTEAPGAPAALQRNADEMVFEEFGFGSLYRTIAPTLNAYAPSPFATPTSTATASAPFPGTPLECLLVVDIGHSHTTITPLYHGRPLQTSIRRLDIGGKTLTNQLKAVLSRTVEVQKEDWIVQEIKEDVCYVSASSAAFANELERVWKGGLKDPRAVDTSIVVDYVLPDYEAVKRGFARPHDPKISRKERALGLDGGPREHIVTIGNERFTVPELLFTPSDIGMQQAGLTGTILQSVYSLPKGLWQPFLANILVVGGSSKFPGLMERLEAELRASVSEDLAVRVARARDPVKNVWLGGASLAMNEGVLGGLVVTREEYAENGDVWTRRKFGGKIGR